MRKIPLILLMLLSVGCSRQAKESDSTPSTPSKSGLVATSSPNPCDQFSHPTVPKPPFPFMWFYKTEVRNTLDVPLTIIKFEAYKLKNGQWVAGNITGKTLTAKDFDDWYSDGLKIKDGIIPPGSVALNAVNWHGSQIPTTEPTKWAFWAVEPSYKEHYAEVIVESVPIQK